MVDSVALTDLWNYWLTKALEMCEMNSKLYNNNNNNQPFVLYQFEAKETKSKLEFSCDYLFIYCSVNAVHTSL